MAKGAGGYSVVSARHIYMENKLFLSLYHLLQDRYRPMSGGKVRQEMQVKYIAVQRGMAPLAVVTTVHLCCVTVQAYSPIWPVEYYRIQPLCGIVRYNMANLHGGREKAFTADTGLLGGIGYLRVASDLPQPVRDCEIDYEQGSLCKVMGQFAERLGIEILPYRPERGSEDE